MAESNTFDLQKEAGYVLGMMDMYQSDEEIANILKLKGLSPAQIGNVLYYIKQEGYHKRIRQAKKLAVIGFIIMVCLGGAWFFLKNSSIYSRNDELIERMYARVFINIAFYGFLYGIVQTVFGLSRFIKYSNKLKKI